MIINGVALISFFFLTSVFFKGGFLMDRISIIYQLGFYLISANFYFWTEVRILWLMFRYHKFEFERHAVRQIALTIVTPLSIWISSIDAWYWCLNGICVSNKVSIGGSVENAGLSGY